MRNRHSNHENAHETKAPRLKMKALMAATGVSKATIAHYVKEGLLPMPKRTSRNMAYYDVSCVERVMFIKKMQANHRLPLSQIKLIFEQRDRGREVTPLIELKEVIFGMDGPVRMDLQTFCQTTGLSPDQVETCLDAKLLRPREKGFFDPEDVAAGQMLRVSLDLGIRVAETEFYPRLAEDVVEREMAIQKRLVKTKPFEEAVHTTMELTRVARTLRAYIFDREFQERAFLHEKMTER
jgi:DNA-binding transcriptional MerR regulator